MKEELYELARLFCQHPARQTVFLRGAAGGGEYARLRPLPLFDGMFVGKFLGSTPFAALNLAMPFVIINFALADLIGVVRPCPFSIHLGPA